MADNKLSNRTNRNALAAGSNSNPYIQSLMSKAAKEYPFIAAHNPIVTVGSGEGYAETWPAGETGKPDEYGRPTRPQAFPMERLGIEVYRPNDFTHHDLAGELLHIDPRAAEVRDYLLKSYRPEQWDLLKHHALDYEESLKQGQSEEMARQNAIDSAIRGYAVRQWPEQIDKALNYDPEQLKMLEGLRTYMTTGK